MALHCPLHSAQADCVLHSTHWEHHLFLICLFLVLALQLGNCVLHYVQGQMTSGRIPREATLQLSVELSTALTSETAASELYRDTADASNGAVELAGRAVSAATEQYQSALRLQNMTGQVWGGLC